MSHDPDLLKEASGLAALSICEALALALAEQQVLGKDSVCGAIGDVVAAHREAATWAADPALHRRAADLAEEVRQSVQASGEKREPKRG